MQLSWKKLSFGTELSVASQTWVMKRRTTVYLTQNSGFKEQFYGRVNVWQTLDLKKNNNKKHYNSLSQSSSLCILKYKIMYLTRSVAVSVD